VATVVVDCVPCNLCRVLLLVRHGQQVAGNRSRRLLRLHFSVNPKDSQDSSTSYRRTRKKSRAMSCACVRHEASCRDTLFRDPFYHHMARKEVIHHGSSMPPLSRNMGAFDGQILVISGASTREIMA
jgi:hypothetical protein